MSSSKSRLRIIQESIWAVTRASHVEPDAKGNWRADMGTVDEPVLGPFRSRSEALEAEKSWLMSGRS